MLAKSPALALPPVWDPEEDDRLVCRAAYDETHDVRTFVFSPPEPRLFRYAPGQYLTFAFPTGPEPTYRCYTLSSAPTRPETVSITVKRTEGGPVSGWLHANLRPGDVVRATGPMGEFSTDLHPCGKRLFLSGGSGVTPLMSMVRADHDRAADPDTVFVHCARTPRDVVFRKELDWLAERRSRLQVAHMVESAAGEPGWSGFRGRISRATLDLIAPDFREREVFCCGPRPFMAAVRAILAEAGCDMARHHEESFAFEELAPVAEPEPAPAEAPGARLYEITFAKSGRTVSCDESTTILAAARSAGLRLPSSCTRGLCGTCKTRKVSGEVEMSHQGGIRQREIDHGLILLCCSKPRGDVTVER
jgi:glycine betaine catabolism B